MVSLNVYIYGVRNSFGWIVYELDHSVHLSNVCSVNAVSAASRRQSHIPAIACQRCNQAPSYFFENTPNKLHIVFLSHFVGRSQFYPTANACLWRCALGQIGDKSPNDVILCVLCASVRKRAVFIIDMTVFSVRRSHDTAMARSTLERCKRMQPTRNSATVCVCGTVYIRVLVCCVLSAPGIELAFDFGLQHTTEAPHRSLSLPLLVRSCVRLHMFACFFLLLRVLGICTTPRPMCRTPAATSSGRVTW